MFVKDIVTGIQWYCTCLYDWKRIICLEGSKIEHVHTLGITDTIKKKQLYLHSSVSQHVTWGIILPWTKQGPIMNSETSQDSAGFLSYFSVQWHAGNKATLQQTVTVHHYVITYLSFRIR